MADTDRAAAFGSPRSCVCSGLPRIPSHHGRLYVTTQVEGGSRGPVNDDQFCVWLGTLATCPHHSCPCCPVLPVSLGAAPGAWPIGVILTGDATGKERGGVCSVK